MKALHLQRLYFWLRRFFAFGYLRSAAEPLGATQAARHNDARSLRSPI